MTISDLPFDDSPDMADDGDMFFPSPLVSDRLSASRPRHKSNPKASKLNKHKAVNKIDWIMIPLMGVMAIAVLGVIERKELASFFIKDWLAAKGIEADINFERLSLSEASGQVRLVGQTIKDKTNGLSFQPQISTQNFNLDFELNPFDDQTVHVSRLVMIQPHLSAVWDEKGLDFGTLNSLMTTLTQTQSGSSLRPADIRLSQALLNLQSAYGRLKISGDIDYQHGRLQNAALILKSQTLTGASGDGHINNGRLALTSVLQNGQAFYDLDGQVSADSLSLKSAMALPEEAAKSSLDMTDALINVKGRIPQQLHHSAMPIDLNLSLTAAGLKLNEQDIKGVKAQIQLDGHISQAEDRLGMDGQAQIAAELKSLTSNLGEAQNLKLTSHALRLNAEQQKGQRLQAALSGPIHLHLQHMRAHNLTLEDMQVNLSDLRLGLAEGGYDIKSEGEVRAHHLAYGKLGADRFGADEVSLHLKAQGHSDNIAESDDNLGFGATQSLNLSVDIGSDHAYWPCLGLRGLCHPTLPPLKAPQKPSSSSDLAVNEVEKFGRGFKIKARHIGLNLSTTMGASAIGLKRYNVTLKEPLVLETDAAQIELSPVETKDLINSASGGAASLKISGSGLPQVRLDVDNIRSLPNSLKAHYQIEAQIKAQNEGPMQLKGIMIKAKGEAIGSDTGLTLNLDDCAVMSADSLSLGQVNARAVHLNLCQTHGDFIDIDNQGVRLKTLFNTLSFVSQTDDGQILPNIEKGNGQIEWQSGAVNEGKINLVKAIWGLKDVSGPPISVDGHWQIKADKATGEAHFKSDYLSVPFLVMDEAFDQTGQGHWSVESTRLNLAEAGPRALFKQITGLEATQGYVRLEAQEDGAKARFTGQLTMDGLDVMTGLGKVKNLNSHLSLSQIWPIQTLPHQWVSMDVIETRLNLERAQAHFQLNGADLHIEDGQAQTHLGQITLLPMVVKVGDEKPVQANVTFDGLDFGKALAVTDLAHSLFLNGQFKGQMGFNLIPKTQVLSLSRAHLTSIGKGSIKIAQDRLQLKSPPPALVRRADNNGLVAQIADSSALYRQALSSFSYDSVSADVQAGPENRLDMVMTMSGQYEGPEQKPDNKTQFDAMDRDARHQALSLPKGTALRAKVDMEFHPLTIEDVPSERHN